MCDMGLPADPDCFEVDRDTFYANDLAMHDGHLLLAGIRHGLGIFAFRGPQPF